MAKNKILEFIIWVLSIPFRFGAILFELFNINNISEDVNKLLFIIDKNKNNNLDEIFIKILILAEDRRNSIHYGVDPISIIRAIKVKMINNISQGASTIEQQFTRVVTNRYEKTFSRKIREQILAIAICKRRSKRDIANAYLSIAYYGTNLNGILALNYKCNLDNNQLKFDDIVGMITRLKYPEPQNYNYKWEQKFIRRKAYIKNKIKKLNF